MKFSKFSKQDPEAAKQLETYIAWAQDERGRQVNNPDDWVVFEIGGLKFDLAAQHRTVRELLLLRYTKKKEWVWPIDI